jgi:hypothetical protein
LSSFVGLARKRNPQGIRNLTLKNPGCPDLWPGVGFSMAPRCFFERQTRANRAQQGVCGRKRGFSRAKRAKTMFFRAQNGRERCFFERETTENEVFSNAKRAQMG